jgi:hypothetical protein
MRLIASFLLFLAWNTTQAIAIAQPQVDEAEVLRLGDTVQTVGSENHVASVDERVAALAPPASDADKWFISIVTTKGCTACEQLQRDWAKDPWLLALAVPDQPQQSWSHFNVYQHEDQSQSFRFEGISISAYPTVIVQPPRSGKFGDPNSVVFQGIYGGQPRELAEAISQSISRYVGTLEMDAISAAAKAATHEPPWTPTSIDESSHGSDAYAATRLDRLLQIIPPREPAFPWAAVLTSLTAGMSIPTAAALLVWSIQFTRGRRQATGKLPLMDPAKLDRLVELLQALAEGTPPPPFRRS